MTYDRYFCSILASTYPNRHYMLSAQSGGQMRNVLPSLPAGIQWETIFDRAGARGVEAKRGALGCIVDDGHKRAAIAPHRVATVDATGAGDCFDGAFVARLCAGDSPLDAARFANAAAAIATTGYGAVEPLPRPRDVDALLRRAA